MPTSGVPLELVPTGLFSGAGARPLDAGFASYAWDNDQRIERLSGQRFTQAYLDNVLNVSGTLLDSSAATLGIVAAGLDEPGRRLPALKAIQHARYVDGRDIVTVDGVAAVLTDAGMADAAAMLKAPTDALMAARRDLVGRGRALFQRLNANGVPALAVIGKASAAPDRRQRAVRQLRQSRRPYRGGVIQEFSPDERKSMENRTHRRVRPRSAPVS